MRLSLLLALALASGASALPPSGVDIAKASNVVWTDPIWKSDGTGMPPPLPSLPLRRADGGVPGFAGAMPIGNGDVTSSVWVDGATGDLRLLVSKSDVFDENSQPVKTGVLRITFDPPLWTPPAPPAPVKSDCKPIDPASPLSAFFKEGGAGKTSTICDQSHLMKVAEPPCSSTNETVCAAQAAKACCTTAGCVAFSLNPTAGRGVNGHAAEFCGSTRTNVGGTPGSWALDEQLSRSTGTWTMIGAPPPPAPAPVGPTGCTAGQAFCQTLDLASSTVTIKTRKVEVTVSIDLNAPAPGGGTMRIAAKSSSKFGLKVALEPYRLSGVKEPDGRGYCKPRFEQADTIVDQKDKLTWYHWNHINTTYFNDTMAAQGVDPAANPQLVDMFTHRAFGGSLSAAGLTGGGLSLSSSGRSLSSVDVELKLLTMMAGSGGEWIAAVGKLPAAAVEGSQGQAVAATWGEIMERSYIEVSGRSPLTGPSSKQITDHVNWDRCA